MDSKTIRYKNARLLVHEAGGVSAFAEKIGKQQSQVSAIAGESPVKGIGPKIARQIEAAFHKSEGWLDVPHIYLWEGRQEQQSAQANEEGANAKWLGGFDPWDDETPLGDGEVELPLYKEVELAAGSGTHVVAENSGNKLRFSKRTLKSAGVDPSSAACASVTGNSMEPVLLEGTTVGVDTSKSSIKDGDMYAIDHDGMLRIKLLYRMPGNSLKIVSYNKDEWPDELLAPDEAQKVRIIGRVFWWSTLR